MTPRVFVDALVHWVPAVPESLGAVMTACGIVVSVDVTAPTGRWKVDCPRCAVAESAFTEQT